MPRRTAAPLVAFLVLAAACGGSSTRSPSTASTPLELPSSSTAAPTASPSGSLPHEAAAVQGRKYYAVFLAVATDVNDDGLAAAQRRAKELGYEGGVGELGCTPGAQQQLGLKPSGSYVGFSVFFATRAQAQQLVAAYRSKISGIAYVTAGCLD